ncbi:MAG: hypothetical protein O7G85_16855, partial [Planctomycetota bacterium]|nr:hypothetical protein [Planctomycetota bacterium]
KGPVLLNNDVLLSFDFDDPNGTGLGADSFVDFDSTVNSAADMGYSLGIDHDLATFNGNVGTVTNGELGELFVFGITEVGRDGFKRLGDGITLNADAFNLGDVLLHEDTTMNAGTTAEFFGSINSGNGAFASLEINAPDTFFGGQIGNAGASSLLRNLTVNSPVQIETNSIIVSETITFNDDVVLTNDDPLLINGGFRVAFNGTINSDQFGFRDLEITSLDTYFGADIGLSDSTRRLGSLTTNAGGTTTIDTSFISVDDNLTFDDDVVLTGTTQLSAGDTLSFGATVNGTLDKDSLPISSLTATGTDVEFHGQVGAGTTLVDLNVIGNTLIDTDQVNANRFVTFSGDVLVAQDTTVSGGQIVNFGGQINSVDLAFSDLTVNSFNTSFNGEIGNLSPTSLLGTLTTTGSAGSSTTINTGIVNVQEGITFENTVFIGQPTAINGGFLVDFNQTVDGLGLGVNLTVTAAGLSAQGQGIVFGDNIGALVPFNQLTVFGHTLFGASTTVVLGNITFNGDVTLNTDFAAINTFSSLAFNGEVFSQADEFNSLGIQALGGTTFRGRVGGDLISFESGEGLHLLGQLLVLAGEIRIKTDSIQAQEVNFLTDVWLDEDTTVMGTNSVTFGARVDSLAGRFYDLTVKSPSTMFMGNIGTRGDDIDDSFGDGGDRTYLGELRTDTFGSEDLTTFNIISSNLTVNANEIIFEDDVIIGGIPGATLILNGITLFDDEDLQEGNDMRPGRVHFQQRVDSQERVDNPFLLGSNLVVNAEDTRFDGQVGNRGFLLNDDDDDEGQGLPMTTSLGLLETNADGLTVINTDIIRAGDVDFQDDVLLEDSVEIFASKSVNFDQRVDSRLFDFNDLTIDSPNTRFGGRVGDSESMSMLGTITTITTDEDEDGTTTFDTDKVVALFGLDINNNVIIANESVWLTGGFIADFAGTIDSEAGETNSLLVTSQETRFAGQIGATDRLLALETDLSGTTLLATDLINSDTVLFNDAVVVGTDLQINSDRVTFERTLDDARPSRNTLKISGDAIFNGEVGGTQKLEGLQVQGTTAIAGGLVNVDMQEYVGAVTFDGDTLISGDNQFIFRSTIDGNGKLMAVGAGDALFAGDITLGSFETIMQGMLVFGQVTINAQGDVLLNDAVMLLDVPSVATIGADGDLSIHAANFFMGQNQKLSVIGNLTIDVEGGTATLGDIGTLGFINVTADTINLLLRAASEVTLPDGSSVTDFGLDIVSGGTIRFSVSPTSLSSGTARSPRIHFSSPTGEGDVTGNLQNFLMHAGGKVTREDFFATADGSFSDGNGQFLDLFAKGPTTSDVATSFAALAELDSGIVIPESQPGPTMRQRLQTDLAIPARIMNQGELATLIAGRAIYFDTPNSTVDPTRQSSQVTVNRLILSKAIYALQTYDSILQGQTPEDIRSELSTVWTEYLASEGENADPAGFAAYVGESGDGKIIERLRLINILQHEIETMGMAPPESAPALSSLAERLMPEGMSIQVFNRILSGVE